jgi:nucleotide-binding universal stress UspA family protein
MAVVQAAAPLVSRGYRRVLVPLTTVPEAERAVATACALADERATVTAAVVIEVSPLLPLDARMDDEERGARVLLARARAAGDTGGVRVAPCVIRARDAAAAILELAGREGSDLIVIGSARPRRRLVRQVLRSAPCRVLVVA